MAILRPAAIANANPNFAIADSHNIYGSFKNHVTDFVAFLDFVDTHIDNNVAIDPSVDWTGTDAWGLYKPWSTLIYIDDARPLIEVTPTDLTNNPSWQEGTDYFDVSLDDSDDFYRKSDIGNATPAYYVYFGNDGASNGSWNTDLVKSFDITTDATQAVPAYWKDLSDVVVGTSDPGLTNIVINDNTVETPQNLGQTVLGSVVTNTANEDFTVSLTTGQNVLDLIHQISDTSGINNGTDILAAAVEIGGNHKIRLDINPQATLDFKTATLETFTATGNSSVGGTFSAGATTLSSTLAVTGAVTLSSLSSGIVTSTSGVLGTSTASALFTGIYPDLVESAVGTANQIVVSGTAIAGGTTVDGDVTVALADNLIVANANGGSFVVGGDPLTSGHAVGATIWGNTIVNGSFTATGGIVNTTSSEVSFEDNLLSLNVTRDNNGQIEVTEISTVESTGSSGIEVFMGATNTGVDDAPVLDSEYHSRPYFKYKYDSSTTAIPGAVDASGTAVGETYGRWYLANGYTENAGTYNPIEGYVLSSLDVAVEDDGIHIGTNNTISDVVTSYTLLNKFTLADAGDAEYEIGTAAADLNQDVTRHFGRVSTHTVTFTDSSVAGAAPIDSAIEIVHKLNSDDVLCFGMVVTNTSGNLPSAGNMIFPESRKGTTANSRKVKVQGVGNSDEVKFVFIG